MDRTIVKFDSLPNTDRAGAKYQHLFGGIGLNCLIFAAINRIVIGRTCLKLCGAGIHHFVCRKNALFIAHIFNFFFFSVGKPCYHSIRKFHALGFL